MSDESRLTVGDGIRFGIGVSLVPLILAVIVVACMLAIGGFAELFSLFL